MNVIAQYFLRHANNEKKQRQFGIVAILTVVMIWAGWIVVSSWGVHQYLTAWDITFLRFLTAACLTAPLLYQWRRKLPSIFNRRTICCALGCGFPYTITSFLGLTYSPASNAGVIVNGLLPVFTAIIVFLWLKKKLPSDKLFGMGLIALANMLIFFDGGGAHVIGCLFLLCAVLIFSLYSVAVRAWDIPLNILLVAVPWVNFILFTPIWLVAPSGIYAASSGEIILQMLYQGILVSLLALYLIGYAIRILGSVTAATFLGLVPVICAVMAFLFLHEPLTFLGLVSVGICSLGIAIYNLRRVNELS